MTELGAIYEGGGRCRFRVWAPRPREVRLRLVHPDTRELSMTRDDEGYWHAETTDVRPGSRYFYVLDTEKARPDPASGFQPEGVHGPSQVVDQAAFEWTDQGWEGTPLEDMLLYELHVGAFTPEGTFAAIIPRLPELRDLGVNAVELMPVAQFPGERNWGYDGVDLYAVQASYGGPGELKALVDAIHRLGMAVVLDVVYNHLGPEGNYLPDFGPYFTDAYKTPWGRAVNFDRAHSNHVRNFFIQNALHWLGNYHLDALRLDALHAIHDQSAKHFLQELAENVGEFSHRTGHKRYLIGESDLNDVRLIKSPRNGGYGLDSQWSDDFHHSLHTLLTGETHGYYADFGTITHLAKAYREGFVYSWDYSVHRKRFHGSSSRQQPAHQFVVCSQNHDQVGNRMRGERLEHLVDFESLKLSAGVLLLSPYVPLLFMGQEYGEETPFQYFVSHSDEKLIEAVRRSRKRGVFASSSTQECPDPQAVETFNNSKLRWDTREGGRHRVLLAFYQRLIQVRRSIPQIVGKENLTVRSIPDKNVLTWLRQQREGQVFCMMNFSDRTERLVFDAPATGWLKVLDSADTRWDGPGTTLPERIHNREQISLSRRSMVVCRTDRPASPPTQAAAAYASVMEGTSDGRSGGDV